MIINVLRAITVGKRRNSPWLEPDPHFFKCASQVVECYDINDLRNYLNLDAWLVLDLDNTTIEPEDHHQEMGGDQWFVSYLNYASRIPLEDNVSHVALVLAVYHAVQQFVTLKLVQPEIADIIKLYQASGKHVLALTARGPEIMEPTLRELNKLGIHFADTWGGSHELLLEVGEVKNPLVLKNGVVFCGGKPKEVCLKALLKFLGKTPNVLMVDDKVKYLEAIKKMVQETYDGTVIGLHYRYLDEKVKKHNFEQAQQKLLEIHEQLPEQAKEAIAKLKM